MQSTHEADPTQADGPRGAGIDRRTALKGAAWAVPVVALAGATPAYAASPIVAAQYVYQSYAGWRNLVFGDPTTEVLTFEAYIYVTSPSSPSPSDAPVPSGTPVSFTTAPEGQVFSTTVMSTNGYAVLNVSPTEVIGNPTSVIIRSLEAEHAEVIQPNVEVN